MAGLCSFRTLLWSFIQFGCLLAVKFLDFCIGPLTLLQIYPTKDYISFERALDALSSEPAFKKDTPGAAAFACAGPVLDNKCVMTNLEWIIDGASLTAKYGIRYFNQETLLVEKEGYGWRVW